jgi:hypothetical protein
MDVRYLGPFILQQVADSPMEDARPSPGEGGGVMARPKIGSPCLDADEAD